MGCSRKCAHATKARMGNKKNGRTWGEISVNVQLSGQPKRRKRSARVWRTVQAHGCDHASEPWLRSKNGENMREELQVIVQTG